MSNQPTVEIISLNRSLELMTKSTISKFKAIHHAFDMTVWQDQVRNKLVSRFPVLRNFSHYPSFHNDKHVQALLDAADPLIKAAIEKNNDLFQLKKDLARYNSEYKKPDHIDITIEEMESCIKVALAGHDVGDIENIDKKGKIRFFPDTYHPGKGSEKISEDIIKQFLGEEGYEDRLIDFMTYLIRETEYNKPNGKPFALFMRLLDFVGNGYFNKDQNRFLGHFLEEMMLLDEDKMKSLPDRNLYKWCNMVPEKFREYLPEEAIRKQIIEIWNRVGGEWKETKSLPNIGVISDRAINLYSWLKGLRYLR